MANAGHLAPYLDGREVPVAAGLPLGIAAGIQYEETALMFPPDAMLAIVSDGVVEAANTRRELFGFERTARIATQPAVEIAEAARRGARHEPACAAVRGR